jgi:hypothetical protein
MPAGRLAEADQGIMIAAEDRIRRADGVDAVACEQVPQTTEKAHRREHATVFGAARKPADRGKG